MEGIINKPSLTLKRNWKEDGMFEFTLAARDSSGSFMADICVPTNSIEHSLALLDNFKAKVKGGIYDFRIGGTGPEHSGGAACIRFHYTYMACICVSIQIESDYSEFGVKEVASKAELYFETDPEQFNFFLEELAEMIHSIGDRATLLCRTERQHSPAKQENQNDAPKKQLPKLPGSDDASSDESVPITPSGSSS